MTDTLQQVLDTPGCERLRDFAAVGPVQRAALELFVDRIRAADQQAEPVATQYIALCDAMNYNERTYSLTSPEEHAKSLVAEIKRLKEQAGQTTDDEMILRGWRRCAVGQRTTQYCGQVEEAVAAERERVAFEMVNEAQRAVQEAAAAEREACAKVCEREGVGRKALEHYAALTYSGAAHDCAVAIRARGEK